jgi:hypothetical protein
MDYMRIINKQKLIAIIAGISIAATAGLVLFRGAPLSSGGKPLFLSSLSGFFSGKTEQGVGDSEQHEDTQINGQDEALSDSSDGAPLNVENFEPYAHPRLPFSFVYPKGLRVSSFVEVNGSEVLVFEGDGKRTGFQISVFAYDESGPLTPKRIHRDLPSIIIQEPQTALIGEPQTSALIFWSHDAVVGRTREVWFIHGGMLYQVSSYAEFDPMLVRVMGTWRFYE